MLNRIVSVDPLPDYRLRVEFADGVAGVVDLTGELTGPMFELLRDEVMFRQAAIDEFGAVCWPNGADLAPDVMHSQITGVSPQGTQLQPSAEVDNSAQAYSDGR